MNGPRFEVFLDEEEAARLRAEAARRGLAPEEILLAYLRRAQARERILPPLFPDFWPEEGGEEAEREEGEKEKEKERLAASRDAIARAYRMPEPEAVAALLAGLSLSNDAERVARARNRAAALVQALRAKGRRSGVEGLIREFSLSSQEGVALMCLAEALLRIPDTATRDALIREKLAHGDWQAHLGHSSSLFVNAAVWGLMVTGRLVATHSERTLGAALSRLLARGGEPLVRAGVDLVMRLLGEQFVCGRTIEEAIARAKRWEARGFRYSYDMLGEAAMTAADAERYFELYRYAIEAIGQDAGREWERIQPGISVKLSALHPRYTPFQEKRVHEELFERLLTLARAARAFRLGFSIDAEDADRLELSLDLFAALAFHPDLAGWNGLGFVVQAYQKRAPFVIDWLVALAETTGRQIPIRLVKGAYWDGEIKRAQIEGLDYPVFTRKVHTDVSYLACAERLLAAGASVFPQFATHNALTVATLQEMAEGRAPDSYEFQCLHGMGETLYEHVVKPGQGPACRIYAPVGSHETLLPYLVRRLLENGANTSFVHRLADPAVPLDALLADPVAEARALTPLGAPHPLIPHPAALYAPHRQNSAGLDLADRLTRARLVHPLRQALAEFPEAAPSAGGGGDRLPLYNPADLRETVGLVRPADGEALAAGIALAERGGKSWGERPAAERAAILERAAVRLETAAPALIARIAREAGRTVPNAVGEIREAADALRYYAAEARALAAAAPERPGPASPLLAISPWNFPLAIFVGQAAAGLAAGYPVIAKPAEETPLTAALAHRLLLEAGVPEEAFILLPGDGSVGARLVAAPEIGGVLFTGSTATARAIGTALLARGAGPHPPLLVAETGGINAMVVDSSALPEQVVADVIVSAFDSAGQRCSALRLLCVQEEIYLRLRDLLLGAMAELTVGRPDRLATDLGPLISHEAWERVNAHVTAMRRAGWPVHAFPLPAECGFGFFFPPTVIEIDTPAALTEEVFGPVLHLLPYRRTELDTLIARLDEKGFALTFGIHSRLEETVEPLCRAAPAGNVYVNRSMIGAVIGVQPFGGHGRSGTGPKAGGPLLLRRLWRSAEGPPPFAAPRPLPSPPAPLAAWLAHLEGRVETGEREQHAALARLTWAGVESELQGPVGERNLYRLEGRKGVALLSHDTAAARLAITALLGMGSTVWLTQLAAASFTGLPPALAASLCPLDEEAWGRLDCVLFDPALPDLASHQVRIFAHAEAVPVFIALPRADLPPPALAAHFLWLAEERAISINTAAIGGNATLMTIA